MRDRIGFMQGRLSPLVNGKIQAFPWEHWGEEFAIASSIGIHRMEWTLDQQDLYKNPLMTEEGQEKIANLCKKYNFTIPSLTGDCFMQAPFYKDSQNKESLLQDLDNIIESCQQIGIGFIVFPLVDNGSLENQNQELDFIESMLVRSQKLKKLGLKIIFESDFPPNRLAEFIDKFPTDSFGINYDMGNSAALGFDSDEEFKAFGQRIDNVHVKDRKLHGSTVPLGTGDVDFEKVFLNLKKINYSGNYILQTARAPNGEHVEFLNRFIDFVLKRV